MQKERIVMNKRKLWAASFFGGVLSLATGFVLSLICGFSNIGMIAVCLGISAVCAMITIFITNGNT